MKQYDAAKKMMGRGRDKYQLIRRFYDPVIISTLFALYGCIYFFPFKFIPDCFHLSEIENFRTFIWSLFTVTLGFSGLILTLLLLSYNFYFKSTRRKTLEFIFDNHYFKLLFSGFFSLLTLHMAGFLMINHGNGPDHLAVIYFLLILTVGYIIFQLPLAILGLKYSTSMEKINKIISEIGRPDIKYLTERALELDHDAFQKIEENKIIIAKDIGLNAIRDGDWVLPQTILNSMFGLIVRSFDAEPMATTSESITVFLWMSNHFRRASIKSGDRIIVNVLYGYIIRIYFLLCEKNKYQIRDFVRLDNQLKEFLYAVIQSHDYAEIRERAVKDYVEIMTNCIKTLDFTDEELPTDHYVWNVNKKARSNHEHAHLWTYFTRSQTEVLVYILETGINQKDELVYRRFDGALDKLYYKEESANLTESQRISYIKDLQFNSRRLTELAVRENLGEQLSVVTHSMIITWIEKGWTDVYHSALYTISKTLNQVISTGKSYDDLLDDFFMVGRQLSHKKMDLKTKEGLLDYILDRGLMFYDNKDDSRKAKYDIQHQLRWLFNMVKDDEDLLTLHEKYQVRIDAATKGYDYRDFVNF